MTAAQVIILTVYPVEKKGTMMGTYGLATTAAPVIAPTIAGLMIDAFGWKSIFWVALVIMAVSFVISSIVFDDVLELQDKKFDVISFVESIVAFGGITLGIGNISSFGLISIEGGLPLVVGAIVCVFFMVRQCTLEKPFLDVRILANETVPRCQDSGQLEIRGQCDRQHGALSGYDGLLCDDAAVCSECYGIFGRCLRTCHTAGISCDCHRQPVRGKSV